MNGKPIRLSGGLHRREGYHKSVKVLTKTICLGFIIGVLFSQQAQAVFVNGNITFAGNVTLNTSSAGTATQVSAWSNTTVQSADGSFTGNTGAAVAFTSPWSFNTGAAIPNFWSVGGFSFELTQSAIDAQGFDAGTGDGFVMVSGTGWISGNGFDLTYGTWNFSTQDAGGGGAPQFSFSAASGAVGVPEGGSTLGFLTLALAGIGVLRRKIVKPKR